ncbi:hypothetical protein IWQ61_009651, partial [Dispira simplex]
MKTSYTLFLVGGMLVTGTLNTLLTKLQDMQCVGNCHDQNPAKRQLFEQPTWQTLNMFVGEILCLVVLYVSLAWNHYQRRRHGYSELVATGPLSEEADGGDLLEEATLDDMPTTLANTQPLNGWKTLLMWLPALFDICGTTLMNVGLIYTSASVYQMLRGAVVIFSGIFSVLFLGHRLYGFQWLSLVLIMAGVGLVGMSSVLFPPPPPPLPTEPLVYPLEVVGVGVEFSEKSFLGVMMVLMAQVFTAMQFVVEEKIMHRYHLVPMRAVGLEGMFGFITVSVAIPVLHGLYGSTHPGSYFD